MCRCECAGSLAHEIFPASPITDGEAAVPPGRARGSARRTCQTAARRTRPVTLDKSRAGHPVRGRFPQRGLTPGPAILLPNFTTKTKRKGLSRLTARSPPQSLREPRVSARNFFRFRPATSSVFLFPRGGTEPRRGGCCLFSVNFATAAGYRAGRRAMRLGISNFRISELECRVFFPTPHGLRGETLFPAAARGTELGVVPLRPMVFSLPGRQRICFSPAGG